MIEQVKKEIYQWEGKELDEVSYFYSVIHNILIARWTKGNNARCTPLFSSFPQSKVIIHLFLCTCACAVINPSLSSYSLLYRYVDIIAKNGWMEVSAGYPPPHTHTRIERSPK
jgi:hypothetical protein